jgi:uncharacterized phage-associated protein
MRLNKLLYFAQGHALERFGKPLFSASFEAWDYGPVVPEIYHKYKYCGDNPIAVTDDDYNPASLPPEIQEFLIDISLRYETYSTSALVSMSHKPGSPWSLVKRDCNIPVEDIKAWFAGPGVQQGGVAKKTRKRHSRAVNALKMLPASWHDAAEDAYWEEEARRLAPKNC